MSQLVRIHEGTFMDDYITKLFVQIQRGWGGVVPLSPNNITPEVNAICLPLQIAENVKEFFHNEGIHSTTIQPEFVEFNGQGNKRNKYRMQCVLD